MSRLNLNVLAAFLVACSGNKDDGTIIPDGGDGDTDADSDSDSDADTDADSDADSDVEPPPLCAPIPVPGDAIQIDPSADLASEIASAPSGATLALADGTYSVVGPIRLSQPITLMSQSGQRDGVTIDGGRDGTNLLEIAASDVTIAHLTLTASWDELISIQPAATDLTGIRLHDLHLLDPGRFAVVVEGDSGHYADDGELSCSLVELTLPGQGAVREQCNTGGIDAYGARGWVVRDNEMKGFWCPIGTSGPAVRFTRGSRDTEVTRNTLSDVVFGIVLGETEDQIGRVYPDEPCETTDVLQHVDGHVTNNIIAAFDIELTESDGGIVTGIGAESSCNVHVIHNSVYAAIEPESSIEHRYATTTGVFANNLMSHVIRRLDDSEAEDVQNLENQPFDTWFYPAMDDFHTSPGATRAVDQGSPDYVAEVGVDIDNEPRSDGLPDVGADEVQIPGR